MSRQPKYDDKIRAEVVAQVERTRAMFTLNAAVTRVSKEFGVSKATIVRWIQQANATNAAGQPSPFEAVLREMSDRLTLLASRVDGLQEQLRELRAHPKLWSPKPRLRPPPIDDGEDRHVGEPI